MQQQLAVKWIDLIRVKTNVLRAGSFIITRLVSSPFIALPLLSLSSATGTKHANMHKSCLNGRGSELVAVRGH